MATFAYSGRTRAGQTVTGERNADSMDGAVAALRREQILVTQINPVKAAAKGPARPRGRAVSAKSLAVFTRQFSVMIDAGLPLVQCLEILGTQEEDNGLTFKRFKEAGVSQVICCILSPHIQRNMQGNDIGFLHDLLKAAKLIRSLGSFSWRIVQQDLHSK
jgi:hypothetical protein